MLVGTFTFKLRYHMKRNFDVKRGYNGQIVTGRRYQNLRFKLKPFVKLHRRIVSCEAKMKKIF